MLKGIYLGACRAYHPNYNLDYNDIVPGYHNNIICDMLVVDLSKYDYIIATPPCNYYSRANWRRNVSDYALKTKHLLPGVIVKCVLAQKPFIIENVRNYKLFYKEGIIELCEKYGVLIYEYGRHTYFTNMFLDLNGVSQVKDNIQYISNSKNIYREGGFNVHNVVEWFLRIVND